MYVEGGSSATRWWLLRLPPATVARVGAWVAGWVCPIGVCHCCYWLAQLPACLHLLCACSWARLVRAYMCCDVHDAVLPWQIMLGPYAANVSSPELYTPGAKFLFILNYFTNLFFRGLITALSVLSYVLSCLLASFTGMCGGTTAHCVRRQPS